MRRPPALFSLLAGAALILFAALLCRPADAQDAVLVNYAGWERDAARAEGLTADSRTTSLALEQLRVQVVDWRTRLTEAQATNSTRIDTLKTQIAALGAGPADGKSESPQIAARRAELGDQLTQLQAPGIAASEALGRAEGIIREIDRIIRDRQAQALLRLSPTPLNPLNWPAGLAVLTQGARTLWDEVAASWAAPGRRTELNNNLPIIILYLLLAGLLMTRGTGLVERAALRLHDIAPVRTRNVVTAMVSLGQMAVPVAGTLLLVAATRASGMTGVRSGALISAIPGAAFAFFAANWLGTWLFPPLSAPDLVPLTNRPRQGRLLTGTIGLIFASELFRRSFTTEVRPPLSMAAQAVWAAPLVCLVGIFAFRLGLLLRRQAAERVEREATLFRNRLIGLLGTATAGVSVLAPLLAVVGYVTAANALMWPTVLSLALIGFIILMQRFATAIYMALTQSEESASEALFPVLISFALGIAAMPFFALTWGARTSDLSELWSRFREGVAIGNTRISPTAFLTFVIVFAIGYAATRLIQGAVKSSVLPRTSLDKGSQNAVAAGLGYIGIFLSALAAINAAGIDLSSLAIVAGALSVGIGFGLQNIVQNFVSGIILLIERPISEGDMIEVGNKMGFVKTISVRSTRIETFDRTDVIVPNADLVSGVVTNWTRSSLTGRLIVPLAIGPTADTRRAAAILREIAEAQPAVLIEPEPAVVFTGFNATGCTFELRMLLSDVNLKPAVQSDINHAIVERFRAEGIEVAFNPPRDLSAPPAGEAPPAAPPEVTAAPPRPARRRGTVRADPKAIRNDPDEGEDRDRI